VRFFFDASALRLAFCYIVLSSSPATRQYSSLLSLLEITCHRRLRRKKGWSPGLGLRFPECSPHLPPRAICTLASLQTRDALGEVFSVHPFLMRNVQRSVVLNWLRSPPPETVSPSGPALGAAFGASCLAARDLPVLKLLFGREDGKDMQCRASHPFTQTPPHPLMILDSCVRRLDIFGVCPTPGRAF